MLYYGQLHLPERMEERFAQSLRAFSTAIELRFPNHTGLTEDVVTFARTLGRKMNLSPARLKRMEKACRLRDIGLCAIPYRLVNSRSYGTWTSAEQATYDRHPEVSGAMLELVPSLRSLANIVRLHHAAYDGSSWPGSPAGREIPIESRIIKVAVEYVWLSRWEGSRAALESIRARAGAAYDPAVAEVLERVLTSSHVEERSARMVL